MQRVLVGIIHAILSERSHHADAGNTQYTHLCPSIASLTVFKKALSARHFCPAGAGEAAGSPAAG